MSAVPIAKAGVGSAVNDTTRELGGALGIAIFGSIANAAYRANIDVGGLGLSSSAAREVEESVGAAQGVAARVGGEEGAAVLERAGNAFTDAFTLTASLSVAMLLAAGFLVLRTFSRAKEHEAATASAARDPFVLDLAASETAAD
jgi:hypothetical protein